MKNDLSFDVVVVGGGHAGCEAASASARLGVSTALFTHKIETIGEMSCNPAIGGLGKGHLVREIDALDGIMGDVADKSGIRFRLLNKSRGPAVRGPRTQSDRSLYKKYMQQKLLNYCNLSVYSDPVIEFIFEKNSIKGFLTQSGKKIQTSKLYFFNCSLNPVVGFSLYRPAGVCFSPTCIKPFKKVPVVSINFDV